MQTGKWGEYNVFLYEGNSDGSSFEDHGIYEDVTYYTPWIVEEDDGLRFVCPDWALDKNNEWDVIQLGIPFTELLNKFLDTEMVYGSEEHEKAINRRNIAIAEFEKAIDILKNTPLRLSE